MKYLAVFIALAFSGGVEAQDLPAEVGVPPVQVQIINLQESIQAELDNMEFVESTWEKLKTPTTEVVDAILFLDDNVVPEDQPYIRFFTTYAVPTEDMRKDVEHALSFTLHSLIGAASTTSFSNSGGYYPVSEFRVPGSQTLYWIDIRNFNWTPQTMEVISQEDAYFVEPLVEHEKSSLLRLMSGNSVLRADWFVYAATNTQLQRDAKIPFSIYETLLYANTKRPTVLEDFRLRWGFERTKAKAFGATFNALVTRSKNVAFHNRILEGAPSYLGWYYETYDVLHQRGNRDYVENFPTIITTGVAIRDAGEAFTSNSLQLQVYALFGSNKEGTLPNGQETIVTVADAGAARHMTDVLGDARVIVARSCFDCHAGGPLMPENTIREFLGTIKLPKKQDALAVDRQYLSGRFEDSVDDFQKMFARAIKKVNGLTPSENHKAFLRTIMWYHQDIDLNQAAWECGITVDKFIEAMRSSDKLSGRLSLLLNTPSHSIPRETWGSPGADGIPGIFQQAMIQIHGLTQVEEINDKVITRFQKVVIAKRNGVLIRSGTKTLARLDAGQKVKFIGYYDSKPGATKYVQVEHNGVVGYIKTDDIEVQKK